MVSRTVLLSVLLMFLMLPLARAQGPAVLDKTTFGKSQNDDRDLMNSLTAEPAPKYGKGEKKALVSAAELKSKSMNDTTFGGSLLNIGIDPSVPKLDESKSRATPVETQSRQQLAATEKEPTVAKQTATVEKQSSASSRPVEFQPTFSNLSTTATLAEKLNESDASAPADKTSTTSSNSSAGDAQKKDQTGTATAEKPSTTSSSDKSSDPKPNGDH
jgi:hypothetical protein